MLGENKENRIALNVWVETKLLLSDNGTNFVQTEQLEFINDSTLVSIVDGISPFRVKILSFH